MPEFLSAMVANVYWTIPAPMYASYPELKRGLPVLPVVQSHADVPAIMRGNLTCLFLAIYDVLPATFKALMQP